MPGKCSKWGSLSHWRPQFWGTYSGLEAEALNMYLHASLTNSRFKKLFCFYFSQILDSFENWKWCWIWLENGLFRRGQLGVPPYKLQITLLLGSDEFSIVSAEFMKSMSKPVFFRFSRIYSIHNRNFYRIVIKFCLAYFLASFYIILIPFKERWVLNRFCRVREVHVLTNIFQQDRLES